MRISGKKSILDIFDGGKQDRIIRIPVNRITAGKYQPRIHFDDTALQDLSTSIKEHGLIQPITVRELDGKYEIIAGERRFRACKMAGYTEVPCVVMSPTDEEAAQMALVENIQRQDLSAVEEARSYVQIMKQSGLNQEQMAEKLGKSQSFIANKIRLLNLPEEIQTGIQEGKITERHGRAILAAEPDQQLNVYEHVVDKSLTVRQTEEYIAKNAARKKEPRRTKTKGFTRNTKLAVNSVKQCVEMIEKLGIQVKTEQQETDDELQMIIRIPKK